MKVRERIQIVCVGDELLRGETEELNSSKIARELSSRGLAPERISIVGDDSSAIGRELISGLNFLTGGLGPTHDDVTRRSVATALGLELVQNEEALASIEDKSEVPEHRRMATIPEGSEVLRNAAGVAPGFIVGSGGVEVACLPGPPEEMEATLETALAELDLEAEKKHSVELTLERGESEVLEVLDGLFETFPDLDIGSYPGGARVRVRIAGDRDEVEEAEAWLSERLGAG